jgi:hypothetical protein
LSFCVFAASTFWFLHAMNNDYTDTISYPVKIIYDSEKVVPVAPLPDQIKMNVTGYGWDLLKRNLGFKVSSLQFEPDNLPEKNFISPQQLASYVTRQLANIRLNYILSDTLFFNFDYVIEKNVRVVVDSQNISLAPSYKIITPLIISPDSIIFRGPASFVRIIPDSIKITISQTDLKEKFEANIKVPEQGYHHLVTMLNKEVRVRFDVAKFEKESRVINMRLLNFPSPEIIPDKKIILTYFVKEDEKNKIGENDFEVLLNYKDLDTRDSSIGPRLVKKPAFVKDFYFTPYAVKIEN